MDNLNDINVYIELGKRIRYLRRLKKMSIEDLALECNINVNYLSDVERGQRNPTLKIFTKICIGLNITLEELFKGISTIL